MANEASVAHRLTTQDNLTSLGPTFSQHCSDPVGGSSLEQSNACSSKGAYKDECVSLCHRLTTAHRLLVQALWLDACSVKPSLSDHPGTSRA